jgi:hypothetical protein
MPHFGTDFDPIRFASRLLLHGEDPYASLGPGLKYYWNFRLLYPLPAVLLGIPFLAVPIIAARAIFVALACGLLAFFLSRRAWWPLLACVSAPFWSAAAYAQWSPFLTTVALAPPLGFLLAAKPNVGLAIVAFAESLRSLFIMLAGMAAITVVAFVAMPRWPIAWAEAIRGAEHVRPLMSFAGGWLLLLAGIRWRRPEARLLLALAILPQNPAIYEGLLLFLIPKTARQALVLATLSWFVEPIVRATGPYPTFAASATATGYAMLGLMYIPGLFLVLRLPSAPPPPPAGREAVAE